jgi:hypothetical protein
MVALVAVPASAAVQSVKVSGALESTWIVRYGFDLGVDIGQDPSAIDFYQNIFITQATVAFDADLTDNVSVKLQLINERPWDAETNANTDIDLNLAYLEMREFYLSSLTAVVGRMPVVYGTGFILGGGPNNVIGAGGLVGVAEDFSWRTEFDGVKLIFDYDPLTVDLFAYKVAATNLLGAAVNDEDDDIDLYGVNSTWSLGDEYNSSIESYFFAKIDRTGNTASAVFAPPVVPNSGQSKADTVYVPGFRVSSNPIEGLMTSLEMAWQYGNKAVTGDNAGSGDNLKRDAMGAQVIASYAIPGETIKDYTPVVSGSYTYVSGDSNPDNERDGNQPVSDNEWNGWDQMFEGQAGGTIYNTLFDLTNAHIYNLGLQINPWEDVTAKVSWWGIWLDKEIDEADGDADTADFVMRQPDGTTLVPVVAVDETMVGNELDAELMVQYTEDVELGFIASWFLPGDVFTCDNDEPARQFITKASVLW